MIDEELLRQRMHKIADLVNNLDSGTDSNARRQSKELLEAVMDLHGEAVDRIVGRLNTAGPQGEELLQSLAADPVVASVLLLYGLHPLDLEARVRRTTDRLKSEMRAHGCDIDFEAVRAGIVHLRIKGAKNAFTAHALRKAVEDELYSTAPDMTTLVLNGLEEFAAADFVPLEKIGAPTLKAGG